MLFLIEMNLFEVTPERRGNLVGNFLCLREIRSKLLCLGVRLFCSFRLACLPQCARQQQQSNVGAGNARGAGQPSNRQRNISFALCEQRGTNKRTGIARTQLQSLVVRLFRPVPIPALNTG